MLKVIAFKVAGGCLVVTRIMSEMFTSLMSSLLSAVPRLTRAGTAVVVGSPLSSRRLAE